jgi:hypothetical protein
MSNSYINSFDYRIRNRPIKVHWLGWRTDTFQLQQAGWQMAAEEDIARQSFRMIFKYDSGYSDGQIYGISNLVSFNYMREPARTALDYLVLTIQHLTSNVSVSVMDDLSEFRQVDAEPYLCNQEIKDIEDFKLFSVPLTRTEELIVEPKDVNDLMQEIMKLQSPKQKEIRDKRRRTSRQGMNLDGLAKGVPKVHAQIITLAS